MEANMTPVSESMIPAGLLAAQIECKDSELESVMIELDFAPQQSRIIRMVLQGQGDKQIAAAMGIKFGTVRTYISRAFARAGVSGRMELASFVFARILSNRNRKGAQQT